MVELNKNTTHAEAFSLLMSFVNEIPSLQTRSGIPTQVLKIGYHSQGIQTAVAQFMLGLGAVYHLEEYIGLSGGYAILTLKPQAEIPQRHLTVHVPAGIGDIAWVMMKLQQALGSNGTCDLLVSGEGPKRGLEFAELYPCVKSVKYSDVGYQEIHKKSRAKDSGSLELDFENGQPIYLSANSHLELGNRIESYLPHYPVKYDLHNLDHLGYQGPPMHDDVFKIGIYPSSYKTNKEWNCGTPEIWCDRIEALHSHFVQRVGGDVQFFLIGAVFDRRFATEIERIMSKRKLKYMTNTVGLLHISTTIQMIDCLDVLVSFPSGIGIIGSMVDTPTVMMMPTHLRPMEYKWVDPKAVSQGRFIQLQLNDIEDKLIPTVCGKLNYG